MLNFRTESRWLLSMVLMLSLAGPLSAAKVDVLAFDSPEQEARYRTLTEELRCTVCQNQNIADSNADLANDLRHKTYEMLRAGKSDQEIIDYMVARYGNFVLYRPPMAGVALLLWVVPFLLVALSGWLVIRAVKRRSAAANAAAETEQEVERIRRAEAVLNDQENRP